MKFLILAFLLIFTACDDDKASNNSCIPECTGKVCGDDGCGGVCGSCPDEMSCQGGMCVVTDCGEGCTDGCPQGCFDVGDCSGGSDGLRIISNIHTAGIYYNGSVTSPLVFYRQSGEQTWFKAHEVTAIQSIGHVTSLFSLLPGTEYEVLVSAGNDRRCTSFTTQALISPHETIETLYVDDSAASGGDGSQANPYQTISEAVAQASGGTDIIVAPGIYHESISVTSSGTEGSYIRILGESGAILDGSAETTPVWTQESDDIYSTSVTGNPTYIVKDGLRMYHYTSMSGLEAGLGDDDVPMDEGFFVENGTLYVRATSNPSSSTWSIPDLSTAFALDGAEWIWIEGFTIRYFGEGDYPKGIDIRDSNDVVVRKNIIHDIKSPVWIRRSSARSRIEENEIYQTSVHLWPWDSVKGTDHENSAITASGTEGAIVRGNHIHEIFNGVYTGSFDDDVNPEISFDTDVYDNTFLNIADDALEPEGACVNNRFRSNSVSNFHNGISLAPITFGPVWVMRNLLTFYDESALKFSNDSYGRVFIYHNTCFTDYEDHNALNVSGYFENMMFRNNIFAGTRYAFEMSQEAGDNDLDYNLYYTSRGVPIVKWDDVRYDTISDWCTATGLECHGLEGNPQFSDVENGDFSLIETSPGVESGVRIYGINDAFSGSSPESGCYERL